MNLILSEDQLKALVETWRGVRKGGFRAMDDYGFTVVEAVETCADELSAILATAKRVEVDNDMVERAIIASLKGYTPWDSPSWDEGCQQRERLRNAMRAALQAALGVDG